MNRDLTKEVSGVIRSAAGRQCRRAMATLWLILTEPLRPKPLSAAACRLHPSSRFEYRILASLSSDRDYSTCKHPHITQAATAGNEIEAREEAEGRGGGRWLLLLLQAERGRGDISFHLAASRCSCRRRLASHCALLDRTKNTVGLGSGVKKNNSNRCPITWHVSDMYASCVADTHSALSRVSCSTSTSAFTKRYWSRVVLAYTIRDTFTFTAASQWLDNGCDFLPPPKNTRRRHCVFPSSIRCPSVNTYRIARVTRDLFEDLLERFHWNLSQMWVGIA